MPKNTPPKLLPKLTYDPPFSGAGKGGYEDYAYGSTYAANPEFAAQYGGTGGMPPVLDSPPQEEPPTSGITQPGYNPMNYYNPLQQLMPPAMDMGNGQTAYPNPQYNPLSYAEQRSQKVAGGAPDYIQEAFRNYYQQNPNGAKVDYPNREGGVADGAIINRNVPQPTSDTRQEAIQERRADAVTQQQTDMARTQDAVQKNQRLTEQAKQQGNDKELARLQAEWDRIAPKAAKYGITAERLVNSYMQPGNPAAESSLDRAMGRAIADDTWANAATIAFGRPPNQVEWDEHWRAMNKGGRDPLEGHPAAIQQIQARMQEIEQENQNEAFGKYQQWLAGQ